LTAARHNYFYPPVPFPPFPDPYMNPYNFPPPYYRDGPYYQPRRMDPRYSAALDVDAEVVDEDEADELLNIMKEEEEEWTTDRERARKNERRRGRRGEVIDFDDEQNLRSAAAYPSDMYRDENKFQGRKPGQAVNKRSSVDEGETIDEERARRAEDPREQHVVMDDYDDYMTGFFNQAPPPPPYGPPPPQRPGPSVYTREEEELIAAMGGRGHRSTQEFAGLGTMSKDRGVHPGSPPGDLPIDPQQRNYNPEQNYAPVPPPMPPMSPMEGQMFGGRGQPMMREEGFLGDSTLKEISMDYSVPIPYLADVLASWGVPVPIDPLARLGDMVTGEQAFAVLEAIHTLDVAALHERYSEDNLMNVCDYYDIDLKEAFEFCVEGRGWALPFGVRTFLRVEQEEELLDALCREDVY